MDIKIHDDEIKMREKLLNSVVEVFRTFLADYSYELFVFGSQANQKKLLAADIDIGVKANTSINLVTLREIKHQLNDELPSLYTFDIVDFKNADDSFAKVALKNIEILSHGTGKSHG
jgi:predicted nucleotidyltransferase